MTYQCVLSCALPLTVKYILVECTKLHDIRMKNILLSKLLESLDSHTFIKEIHFYYQL